MVSDAFTPINSSFSFCNIDRESWCGSEIKNRRTCIRSDAWSHGETWGGDIRLVSCFHLQASAAEVRVDVLLWRDAAGASGSVFTRYSQTFVRLRIRCKYRDGSQREFTERFVLTSKSLFFFFFWPDCACAPRPGMAGAFVICRLSSFLRSTQSPPQTQWIQCTNENSPGLC